MKDTQNYMSRTIVDLDNGTILIETLDDKATKASLKNAIATTLLTPDDPCLVDLFSDKPITLTSDRPPYLLGLMLDQQGQPITLEQGMSSRLLRPTAHAPSIRSKASNRRPSTTGYAPIFRIRRQGITG